MIYRNPHAANVAHIKEAEIVHHPYHEGELSLFYTKPIIRLEDDAVFSTYEEAEALYSELLKKTGIIDQRKCLQRIFTLFWTESNNMRICKGSVCLC